MLMLLIEISLTLSAWRKGWKGWALIPMGLVMLIAFSMGFSLGATGGTIDDVMGTLLLIEFSGVAALIVMNLKAPGKVTRADCQDIKVNTEIVKVPTI